MKTTIELAKECDLESVGDYGNIWDIPLDKLERFRRAVEADFVSRCTLHKFGTKQDTIVYSLPQGETE